MYLLNLPPDPVLLGTDDATGVELINVDRCYVSSWTSSLLASNSTRYADICGPEIGSVMAHVGWSALDSPWCVVAIQPGTGEAVAAGWAGPIAIEDGRRGINMTYAVHSDWEGLGLARLASSLAFLQLEKNLSLKGHDAALADLNVVNVQTRAANARSTALARSWGMRRRASRDFSVQMRGPGRPVVDYATFEMDAPPFLIGAMALAEERLAQAPSECMRHRAA